MKFCSGCNTEKSLDQYNKNIKRKDGVQTYCKECQRQKDKDRWNNTTDRKKTHGSKAKERYLRNRQFVYDWLKVNPCVDCGESDPVVLEFDHRDTEQKIEAISNMTKSYSIKRIKQEVLKCDIRCANCHRRKTSNQFNWYENIIR